MARKANKAGSEHGDLFPELNPAWIGDNRRKAPLFLSKILRDRSFHEYGLLTPQQEKARQTILRWADLESSGKLRELGEQDLKPEFLTHVFGEALGYVLFSDNKDSWELRPRFPLPSGQEADGAIGLFSKSGGQAPAAVMELKGPTSNLDRDRFNGRTPVQQCWDYLNDLPQTPWAIVSNYVSIRLYHRNQTPGKYELFTLQELRDPNRFRDFLFVLDRLAFLPGPLGAAPRAETLLKDSLDRQEIVGKELYQKYHEYRQELIVHLTGAAHGKSLNDAIRIAQTLLDRVIFIAFCQDRDLLRSKVLEEAWRDVPAFTIAQNPRWQSFLNLFRFIDGGDERARIPKFNGGLFEHTPDVDDLKLDDRWTDFFRDIGKYNFRDEVNVDVLGHIFEKSITDVEAIRADPTMLLKAPKVAGRRKKEGIYYTPRKYTRYIVENTLGPCIEDRFAPILARHGLSPGAEAPSGDATAWIACQNEMMDSLRSLRVCDMACGSGAFLIQAFDYLEDRYADLIHPLSLATGQSEAPLLAESRRAILCDNLFGVDLSSEAVEIARLALWIRTAEKGQTLADLSHNILCGNSIVEDAQADPAAFEWAAKFPAVFAEGGFDCIVGNPPYIKLQNFRQAHPKVAAYLVNRYRSAKTGNFDMYLPFIERGIEILRPGGRLGFIAPSVWIYNEYGRGLRELLLENRALERFVDFKSFQAFEDATNYTALQFFRKAPCVVVTAMNAPDGDLESHPSYTVGWRGLSSGAWSFSTPAANGIMETMMERSVTLAEATSHIFQGLVTSADSIYHLIRLGPGRYYSYSLGEIVEIEDEIMKPLVSGADAVPFAVPTTEKYLVFPYDVTTPKCDLFTPKEMDVSFRRAWRYLRRNENALRGREHGKMDHDGWYGYVYPKNLDKQNQPKLLVPRLLLNLFASSDPLGQRSPDNVDVGGVIPNDDWSLFFLLGVLNSRAVDFVWRKTSKPFRGDYRSANKQFIAPLPVPKVGAKQQRPVATLAESLADLHGKRLESFAKVRRRIIVDMAPRDLGTSSPLPPPLPRRLDRFDEVPIAGALAEVSRFAKRGLSPAEREEWDGYLTKESGVIAKLNRRIADLTGELNERINALYGLSPNQVKALNG
jgi:tRNA1(Val) A37 N6-methylase TrmN6